MPPQHNVEFVLYPGAPTPFLRRPDQGTAEAAADAWNALSPFFDML